MAKRTAKFMVEIEYDDENTDENWLAYTLDKIMAEPIPAMMTSNGPVTIGEFHPLDDSKKS